MYKILVVDDEIKIRQTICDYMTAKGFDVSLAENGEIAVDMVESEHFDLIILDVMMPVLDGVCACKEIREFSNTPILFLSALGEEYDMLNAYNSGADDYIVKPFSLPILCKKCDAIIKRSKGIHDDEISIWGVTVNVDKHKVFVDSEEIELTNKDFKLLLYLMENKGIVLNRDLILNRVWGYDYDGDVRVVDTHIKRLRKALKSKSHCIKTVINVGYTFREV